MTIRSYYIFLNKINTYPAIVYVIGSMGSGKTTLALVTSIGLKYIHKNPITYYYNAGDCEITCLDYAIEAIRRNRDHKGVHFVIFDDYSFVVASRSKELYEFLNKLFRIRHLTGVNDIIAWFNGHYSKSLAPFIRSTNYRVITSISPSEIKQYAGEYLFSESDLWEYYGYYVSYPRRKIILAEFRGVSKIIDVSIRFSKYRDKLNEVLNEAKKNSLI